MVSEQRTMEEDLVSRFSTLCSRLRVEDSFQHKWQQLLFDHYKEPLRQYHTLAHLSEMFSLFDEYCDNLHNAHLVALGIFFHDVIYNGVNREDEIASAKLFERFGMEAGMDAADVFEVSRWIRLTATHQVEEGECNDCCFLMDFDMAVLGRDWPDYRTYFLQVKREYQLLKGYSRYPTLVWNMLWCFGRPKAMAGLLLVPSIYATAALHARLEDKARANLTREMGYWSTFRAALVGSALMLSATVVVGGFWMVCGAGVKRSLGDMVKFLKDRRPASG